MAEGAWNLERVVSRTFGGAEKLFLDARGTPTTDSLASICALAAAGRLDGVRRLNSVYETGPTGAPSAADALNAALREFYRAAGAARFFRRSVVPDGAPADELVMVCPLAGPPHSGEAGAGDPGSGGIRVAVAAGQPPSTWVSSFRETMSHGADEAVPRLDAMRSSPLGTACFVEAFDGEKARCAPRTVHTRTHFMTQMLPACRWLEPSSSPLVSPATQTAMPALWPR
jgi:hypothetical protein